MSENTIDSLSKDFCSLNSKLNEDESTSDAKEDSTSKPIPKPRFTFPVKNWATPSSSAHSLSSSSTSSSSSSRNPRYLGRRQYHGPSSFRGKRGFSRGEIRSSEFDSRFYRGGSDFSRGRSNFTRGGSNFARGGSNFTRGGSNFARGGSNFTRGGSNFTRGGSNFFTRGGSNFTRGGSNFARGRSNFTRGGSKFSRGRSSCANAEFSNREPLIARNFSQERYQSKFSNKKSSFQSKPQRGNGNFNRHQFPETFQASDRAVVAIGYERLKAIIEDSSLDNYNIALRLSTESSGFAQRLKEIRGGFAFLILKLFKRLCSDDQPNVHLSGLLATLLDSDFHLRISEVLHEFFESVRVNKQRSSENVLSTLCLMRAWVKYTPNSSSLALAILLPFIKSIMTKNQLEEHDHIEKLLQEVEELCEKNGKMHKHKRESHQLALMHEEAPPDDFRQISVFPTKDDIFEKNPFVRTNLTNSAYQSADHYLDVQFRLLREDFVRPLREGISQYFQNSEKTRRRFDGVKIYHDVSIKFPKLGNRGVTYRLQFNVDNLQYVQWQNSKRLLFGNLVCLSADNFKENFLFASIRERNTEQLVNGFIEVEFWKCDAGDDQNEGADDNHDQNENDNQREDVDEEYNELRQNHEAVGSSSLVSLSDMKKTYAMAESEAYFEAYRHVLAGLQQTLEIPLQQYIVECRRVRDSPRYLRGLGRAATYDFSCIINEKDASSRSHVYNVLDVNNWPSGRQLGLDPSQVGALQSALTNELSIIQGPPGTGKTFVGLMIMKILLHNRKPSPSQIFTRNLQETSQHQNVPNAPILVVCYTNHALDQFLEGIAKFHPEGLVRVGGRGKNENLKKYSLQELRRNVDSSRFSRGTYYALKSDQERQTEEVEEIQDILRASFDSILTLNILESVILPHHYQQLKMQSKKNHHALLNWLGVAKRRFSSVPENSFIVEEPIKATIEFYARLRVPRNRVLQAIACTGQMSITELSACLQMHQHDAAVEPYVNPDIVCHYLSSLPFSRNQEFPGFSFLLRRFDDLEINCAVYVSWLHNPEEDPRFVNPNNLKEWINEKREAFSSKQQAEDKTPDIDDEAELIAHHRMLDEDLFMHVEKTFEQKRQQSSSKIIEAGLHEICDVADHGGLNDGYRYSRQEMRKRRKDLLKRMKKEMIKKSAMTKAKAESIDDIFSLTSEDKWKLYRYWLKTLHARQRIILNMRAKKYNDLVKKMEDFKNRESFEVLKKADVIAMTTTGAAKYRDMIYQLPVQIMIVEEAAEVLEAHIVTSMPRTTQHLILIGDHQQLKPSPTVYELSRKYNLDISLFERMVKNKLPCSRLELQHRMRPRIADLIRPHIYKTLRDHQSVNLYEDVDGVQSNVFFLSHDHLEDNVMDSKSKVNQHEADFMAELCRYLLRQGYKPGQITILTTYVGQLFAFKKALARILHVPVRVTAVDNYQGEENDIILLSLVRSNEEGKIGFLSIENRVCVALSRAKKGLYCIGNFELLREKSDLWKNILDELDRDNLLGDSMSLQCKAHERITKVKCQEDFKNVPEGGCGQPCQTRLDCGHVCYRICHPDDLEHKEIACPKEVVKKCKRGHETSLRCHVELECTFTYRADLPKCGHNTDIYCHEEPETARCREPCEKMLDCGHRCVRVCGDECTTKCKVQIEIELLCGHQIKTDCYKKSIVNEYRCSVQCNEVLKCGHVCRGTCGRCKQGRLHVGCNNKRCGRVLCCGHLCQDNCTSVCPPCRRKCETRCRHSRCTKPCSIPCTLCKEKCNWKCEHYECTMLCSEPCNRPPCNEPCKKVLPQCKHPCIGLCGEPCPDLCRICDKEKVQDILFGDEDEDDARFVQLECKHIFTYQGLDKWMSQENNDESSDSDIKLKECPRCNQRSTRYGNVVNKTLMLINEVRKKVSGTQAQVNSNKGAMLTALDKDKATPIRFSEKMEELADDVCSAASNIELNLVETKYNCLVECARISKLLHKERTALSQPQLSEKIKLRVREVVSWLMMRRYYLSEQANQDLNQERQRLKDMLKLIQLKLKVSTTLKRDLGNNETINRHVENVNKIVVEDIFSYSPSKQETVKDDFETIDKLFPDLVPGLGITDNERKMILFAINLSPGHWFKCKNGHVYCIGECGGASQEGKCPECKEAIGGTSHKLNPGNTLASEMDSAKNPAWNPNSFDIPDDVRRWMNGFE